MGYRGFCPNSSTLLALTLLAGLQTCNLQAGSEVPFEAHFSTSSAVTLFSPPIIEITVLGVGQARHLGAVTSVTEGVLTANFFTGTATGHSIATVTAANGDQLVFENTFAGVLTPTGAFAFEGTFIVLNGTGRFAGTEGSIGSISGWSSPGGAGEFSYRGKLSSPGSLK